MFLSGCFVYGKKEIVLVYFDIQFFENKLNLWVLNFISYNQGSLCLKYCILCCIMVLFFVKSIFFNVENVLVYLICQYID